MTGLVPTVQLLHGAKIPVLGLGTWLLRGPEAVAAVRTALHTGYRLVDTAEAYENEIEVGQGIRQSGIGRSEIFVTTKFSMKWQSVEGARTAFEASCDRLGLDYIDLLMVHWPNPGQNRFVEAVKGLQALLEDGSLRAIGTSNFKPAHLRRVIDETGIVVDVNQIQLSPYSTRTSARRFHAEYGITTQSWSPVGGSIGDVRSDPVVTSIARQRDKTATQVVLRWHIQLGLVAIPKSADPRRIAENIDVFDFDLSSEEMSRISTLDRGEALTVDSDVVGH